MIYFIRDTLSGFIKIGHSVDPRARLAQIQVHCAGAVELMAVEEGSEPREAELHQAFAACRQRGEWFSPTVPLMAHIATLPPVAPRSSATREFWGGKSAKEVAAEAGISGPMLSQIRRGNRRPSPEVAIRLQDATGVSAIKLVFGELADRAA